MKPLLSNGFPAFDPNSQAKTLFLPSPGTDGVLVERQGEDFKQTPMHFDNATLALAWCVRYRACLVFFPHDPAEN